MPASCAQSNEISTDGAGRSRQCAKGFYMDDDSKASGKKYIIFAGINGCGKTALYGILKDTVELGRRISIDDIASALGDWKDNLVQIKAARQAMKELSECIDKGLTFHQETTLPGQAIIKFAKKAKNEGYRIVLYYIGIEDLGIAKERVKRRVAAGGHGIDERIMEKRYAEMKQFLLPLIEECDEIYFYDNTFRFRQIALVRSGLVEDADNDLPGWFSELDIPFFSAGPPAKDTGDSG